MMTVRNGRNCWWLAGLVGMAALLSAGDVLAKDKLVDRIARRVGVESVPSSHPLSIPLRVAEKSQKVAHELKDYEAVFTKQERFGDKLKTQPMKIKLRHEPFSVYIRFGKPHDGREVLYVEGRNEGKLLAHDVGIRAIAGTVKLDLDDDDAMEDNHYPVSNIGMANLIDAIIQQWHADAKYGDVQVRYFPNAKLDGVSCKVIETMHPRQHGDIVFHKTRLTLDAETLLPVQVEQYGFPEKAGKEAPLIEQYTYTKIKTNVNLTDLDFDVDNDEYNF